MFEGGIKMKKRPERKRMTPLLYIQQPHLKHPKAKMQDHFEYQEIQEPISMNGKPEDIKKSKEPVNKEKKLGEVKDTQGNRKVSQKVGVKRQDTKRVEIHEVKNEFDQIEGTKEYKLIQNEKNNMQGFKMERGDESDFENSLEFDQEVPLENFKEERFIDRVEKQNVNIKKDSKKNEEDAIEVELDQNKTEYLNGEEKNKKQAPQKRTPFQEKSLEEKLRDLQRSPVTVVKIRYEFITPRETYLGYFISQKDGVLTIQDSRKGKKIQTIPLESLIDIKMVSI
jgi:hypothetical protein